MKSPFYADIVIVKQWRLCAHAQHWIQDEAQQSCRESLRSDEAPFSKRIKSEGRLALLADHRVFASLAAGPDSAINLVNPYF